MPFQNLTPQTREKLKVALRAELARRAMQRTDKGELEDSLAAFHRAAWPRIDPAPYVHNWHIDAMAEHLEAVMLGHIKRLIFTLPPRCMKSLMVSCTFPAYVWAQSQYGAMQGPHVKFANVSYDPKLSIRDAIKQRRLMLSPWYQDRWGDRFHLMEDKDTKQMYENSAGGFRFSTSVGGSFTGEGADIISVDDSISAKKAQWDSARTAVNEWWDETVPTRLNQQKTGAKIVTAQRLHEDDIVGHILEKAAEDGEEWVHCNFPMEFDPSLDTRTWINGHLFFEDPRTEPDELLWPERFPRDVVDNLKVTLGPFAASAQLQQQPTPRGGSIIERLWWQVWPAPGFDPTRFPPCSLIVGSIDTAYGEKDENAYNAMTVFGIFEDEKERPKTVLMEAWRGRWSLRGIYPADAQTEDERKPHWGLSERVADTVRRRQIDVLLIEDKTRGGDLSKEVRRLLRDGQCQIVMIMPEGNKVARLYATQPMFADQMVYAPDKAWAETVMTECMVAGTKIFTRRGIKNIEDICPGDEVMTHKGRFRSVLRVSERHADDLITVGAKSLDPVTITSNHPFYASQMSAARDAGEMNWVKAQDITARQYRDVIREGRQFSEAYPSPCHALALPIPEPEEVLTELDLRDWVRMPYGKKMELLDDGETVTTSHTKSNSIKWRQPLDKAFGRFVGLYLAEGSGNRFAYTWSFNGTDERHLVDEIHDFIRNRLGCGSWETKQKQANCITVSGGLAVLEGFFEECGKHAHNKRIPGWAWDAPDEFIRGLIDGYADGDGHRQTRSGHNDAISCVTVSPSLAWGIRLLGLRVGIEATMSVKPAGTAIFRDKEYPTKDAYRVIWTETKAHNGATAYAHGCALFSVMRPVAPASPATVYNMDVLEDHSYVTTGGVVHNCSQFPKSKFADYVDTVSQALTWMRNSGALLLGTEADSENLQARTFKGKTENRYDV